MMMNHALTVRDLYKLLHITSQWYHGLNLEGDSQVQVLDCRSALELSFIFVSNVKCKHLRTAKMRSAVPPTHHPSIWDLVSKKSK